MKVESGQPVSAVVLIVDDDEAIRESLAQAIDIEGVSIVITTAHNAVTGIQAAKDGKPDIVILDYNMPMGNGFAVAEAIRATPTLKHTKIIMLTAQDTPERNWESVDHGIDAFIGKPFDIVDVEAHITSLLVKQAEGRK